MQVLKDEIRDRILQAAGKNFLEADFNSSSIKKILKEAKVSNGNLYNYFKNKEEIFYAITTDCYNYLNSFLAEILLNHESEDFSNERINLLTVKIANLLKNYRKELILILDKSYGTKYEKCKEDIVIKITEHLIGNVKEEYKINFGKNSFIVQVLVKNFIEVLLEIAKYYKNDEWVVQNVGFFLQYHLRGINHLY